MLIRRSISSVHKGSHFEGNSSSTGRTLKRQRGTAARWLQFGEEIPACIPGAAVYFDTFPLSSDAFPILRPLVLSALTGALLSLLTLLLVTSVVPVQK